MSRKAFDALAMCVMAGAFWLWTAAPAAAHPHVWVTVEAEVIYEGRTSITGFRHKWTFDEYYSSFAIVGLDKNGDGQYDREELQELAEINVMSLKEFGYFTFPKLSGELLERAQPRDYWLEYDGLQLTLHLTLPLEQPVSAGEANNLTFGIYDPTFYVDFALASENPIRLAGGPEGCAPVVTEPDPQAMSGVYALGEAFFNSLDGNSSEAEQFAKKVSISCNTG